MYFSLSNHNVGIAYVEDRLIIVGTIFHSSSIVIRRHAERTYRNKTRLMEFKRINKKLQQLTPDRLSVERRRKRDRRRFSIKCPTTSVSVLLSKIVIFLVRPSSPSCRFFDVKFTFNLIKSMSSLTRIYTFNRQNIHTQDGRLVETNVFIY